MREPGSSSAAKERADRDYLERTIAGVRNHREAENCWPQWANIFADEIERLWAVEDAARSLVRRDISIEVVALCEANLIAALAEVEPARGR